MDVWTDGRTDEAEVHLQAHTFRTCSWNRTVHRVTGEMQFVDIQNLYGDEMPFLIFCLWLTCGFSLASFRFQNISCHHVERVLIALLSSDLICALWTLILISVKRDIIEKGDELLWVEMHISPKQTKIMSRENSMHCCEGKKLFS